MKRKLLSVCSALLAALLFTACGSSQTGNTNASGTSSAVEPQADMPKKDVVIDTITVEQVEGTPDKNAAFDQLAAPQPGDTIVTLSILGYGDVKIRLFADKAPKAVENFTTHAKNGYYDGLKFHRVIRDFMIQGGDPTGTGAGGESIWGEGFGVEIDKDLHHYAGALAMAQSSLPNSIGSQFYIVTGQKFTANLLEQYGVTGLSKTVRERYATVGGAPYLDGNYTVFGQVYEGQEIVQRISEVDTYTEAEVY